MRVEIAAVAEKNLDDTEKAFARRLAFGIDWDKVRVAEKTGGVDDCTCEYCGAAEKTSEHIIFECPKFADIRDEVAPKLKNVRWQH